MSHHPIHQQLPLPQGLGVRIFSPLEISEYASSLVNSSDSAEASLAIAKLRKINQGLRVGLRDATAGWREAVVLCRSVEKKCDSLEAEILKLKAQRTSQIAEEVGMLDRIRSLEENKQKLKGQVELSKVEGSEVLRQFEAESRGKEVALRQVEDLTEANEKLAERIVMLEAERKAMDVQYIRDREER